MPASDAREVLLRVADRLGVGLGYEGDGDAPATGPFASGPGEGKADVLGAEDELLVIRVRRELTRIAHWLRADEQTEASQRLVAAALDGAEMTMRGELMSGRAEHLPALMPSFVFLVALPIVHQDEAFRLSRRALDLLEEARRQP